MDAPPNPRNLIRTLLAVAVIVGVPWLLWRAGQNYLGYCSAEGRYITNEERIRLATEQEFFERASSPKDYGLFDEVHGKRVNVERPDGTLLPYSNIEEFRRINPQCCSFTTEVRNDEVTLLDRLTGSYVGDAVIRYQVRFRLSDGQIVMHQREIAWEMGNCGPVFRND